LVEAAIRNAHAPNKIEDVEDVFLVRLSSKDDGRAPRSETLADPVISLEDFKLLHDNFAFMRSIMWLLTADGSRGTSIDGEFEVENGKLHTSTIKTIPVRFDDVDDGLANGGRNVKADEKVLGKFREIALAVPDMDVSANVNERLRRMAEGLAELFEFKHTLVDVVGIVHGDVLIDRFGSPNFGRNFDHIGIRRKVDQG